MKKANIEKVMQREGFSWRYRQVEEPYKHYDWHFHQEYELVIHRHFHGVAEVGHYQGDLSGDNMMLIGPHIPHRFYSRLAQQDGATGDNTLCETHVIWFKKEWVANMMFSCVEMRKLESLLKRAEKGVQFSPQASIQVLALLDGVGRNTPMHQLGVLIQVLSILVADKDTSTLLSFASKQEKASDTTNKEKIERVCQFMDDNFQHAITLGDLAKHMNTSESGIHRLFSVNFKENFSQYLKKLRLNHAAELLQTTSQPINLIAESVGYRNQVNFNRQFKQYKQLTPSQYRKKYKVAAAV